MVKKLIEAGANLNQAEVSNGWVCLGSVAKRCFISFWLNEALEQWECVVRLELCTYTSQVCKSGTWVSPRGAGPPPSLLRKGEVFSITTCRNMRTP